MHAGRYAEGRAALYKPAGPGAGPRPLKQQLHFRVETGGRAGLCTVSSQRPHSITHIFINQHVRTRRPEVGPAGHYFIPLENFGSQECEDV